MIRSIDEEILSALWAIAATLAFAAGYELWGYLCAGKAALDQWCALRAAIREVKAERLAEQSTVNKK
jgi:hypothetical protein